MILCASPNAPAYNEAEWRRDCLRRDWPGLAAAAERLLAERLQRDPASVEAQRLTPLEAQNRERIMRDVVAIWRAVVRKEDIPELVISHAATRADLDGAAAAWARISKSKPGDQGCADLADRVAALAWYHQPASDAGTPMIIFCHRFNQSQRALNASRPAKPAPAPAPTPAPAPSRGTARPKAASQQRGFL